MNHKPHRFLMTTDAIGGVWTYARDLALALLPQGIQTTLGVIGPQPPLAALAALRHQGIDIVPIEGSLDWLSPGAEAVRETALNIFETARRQKADVLQVHSPAYLAFEPSPVPTLCVTHSCVASWWESVHGDGLPQEIAWQRDLVGRGLHRADLNVAPSRAFAHMLARLYGCSEPITVHNGRSRTVRRHLKPADFILASGRLWDEAKGIAILDAAAAKCSWPVIAVGATAAPQGGTITTQNIALRGHLREERLRGLLDRRPVFCSPALYEPFGLGVLEAAQHGCALVLSSIPTFQELWQGAALFVPPRDSAALARALDALVRDGEWRLALGQAAEERARSFSVEAQARQMAALCHGLARQDSGRAA